MLISYSQAEQLVGVMDPLLMVLPLFWVSRLLLSSKLGNITCKLSEHRTLRTPQIINFRFSPQH